MLSGSSISKNFSKKLKNELEKAKSILKQALVEEKNL